MKNVQIAASILGKKGGSVKSETKAISSALNGSLGGRPINPILNDDGISIKGCNYIYAPKGQAGEYASLATNPYRGCGHMCAYCYVPKVLRMDRDEFNAGAVVRPDYIKNLRKDAAKYKKAGITEQVMFSFTTDPYPPQHHIETRQAIEILRDAGLGFCTLTKGGTRALRDINLFRASRDAFATTLTSLDDSFSRKWEPAAALPGDRLTALQKFHEAEIFTWVSLEPTLDTEASIKIIEETHSYIDLYKIGRVNYLPMTKTTDWEDYTNRILETVNRLGANHYIKKDLQKYLPENYPNKLRETQNHG